MKKFIIINNNNKILLEQFIKKVNSQYFTYFNNRDSNCIKNHKYTILLINKSDSEKSLNTIKIIGYGHIDYEKKSNKNWLGICILKQYIGMGNGTLILKNLLNYYYNNILNEQLYLTVYKNNKHAIYLYKKFGFKEIEITEKNMILMSLNNTKSI